VNLLTVFLSLNSAQEMQRFLVCSTAEIKRLVLQPALLSVTKRTINISVNCGSPRGTNMTSPCQALNIWVKHFSNNARMKNRKDLDLGEVVYITIIYHISDPYSNLFYGYHLNF